MQRSEHFKITGPALISFSGGRTSAYMLRCILDAYNGKLPADVHVTFANTGKEREETLRFVRDCDEFWGVRVRWVEWRDNKTGFEEVAHNSASRKGEPFRTLIVKKGMPPNWQARFCTQYLKVKAMTAFAGSIGLMPGSYAEVIGLRYDEGPRLLKMLERNDVDGRRCIAPLAKAKVMERDVMAFWASEAFDLGLEPGEGNCDLCFLKGRGLRKELIRQNPESAQWWINAEQSVGGFFDRRDSYDGLLKEVIASPGLFDSLTAVEHDVECGLTCEPAE